MKNGLIGILIVTNIMTIALLFAREPSVKAEAPMTEIEIMNVTEPVCEAPTANIPADVAELLKARNRETMKVVATAYCPCVKCCGKTDGITATGTKATAGRTIAVDPRMIPYGSKIYIDGHEYIAEDCGGAIKEDRIDIFYDTHEEALRFGRKTLEIEIERAEK